MQIEFDFVMSYARKSLICFNTKPKEEEEKEEDAAAASFDDVNFILIVLWYGAYDRADEFNYHKFIFFFLVCSDEIVRISLMTKLLYII